MNEKGIFTDEKGNFKNIDKVTFDDLNILKSIEEGYIVEYKSTFDSSVKNKIPSIVTSFANSDGGWLILGITDDTHEINKIEEERTDFDVTINNKLENVTPKPKFETKFLKESEKDNDGVLLVYIYKGENTPYIANGTVYIRSGSSKTPIKSDRATIDELYKRRDELRKRKEEFTKEIIDINYDGPILNVYMYNPNCTNLKVIHNKKREQLSKIKEKASILFPDSIVYPSLESVVIKNRDFIDLNTSTVYIEIFDNSNIKLSIPLGLLDNIQKENAMSEITHLRTNYKVEDLEEYNFINGNMVFSTILNTFICLDNVFDENNIYIKEYEYVIEFENSDSTIFYWDTDNFKKTIKNNGIIGLNKDRFRTEYISFLDVNNFLEIGGSIFFQMILQYWGICAEEQVDSLKELKKQNAENQSSKTV